MDAVMKNEKSPTILIQLTATTITVFNFPEIASRENIFSLKRKYCTLHRRYK